MRRSSRRRFGMKRVGPWVLLLGLTASVAGAIGLSAVVSNEPATAQAVTGSADYFLKIDGIRGGSTDAEHRDEIELLSYEWSNDDTPGVDHPATGGSKAQANEIHLTERVSPASPLLMVAAVSAKSFPQATLSVRKPGDRPLQFLTIKLSDVTVTSYGTSAQASGTPTDEFALRFGRIEYSYTPQKADGSPGAAIIGTWDTKTNTTG